VNRGRRPGLPSENRSCATTELDLAVVAVPLGAALVKLHHRPSVRQAFDRRGLEGLCDRKHRERAWRAMSRRWLRARFEQAGAELLRLSRAFGF
jgi:hypothetical protein